MHTIDFKTDLVPEGQLLYCKSKDGYVQDSVRNGYSLNICPKKDTCIIHVFQNIAGKKTKLAVIVAYSKNPPKPMIATYINGRLVKNTTESQRINQNDSIEIRIIPDENFAVAMPKETKYAYSNIHIFCMGHQPAPYRHEFEVESPIKLRISSLDYCKTKGSNMYITFSECYRLNGLGEKIVYKSAERNFTVLIEN